MHKAKLKFFIYTISKLLFCRGVQCDFSFFLEGCQDTSFYFWPPPMTGKKNSPRCSPISFRTADIEAPYVARFRRHHCRSTAAVHLQCCSRNSHSRFNHSICSWYYNTIVYVTHVLPLLLTAGLTSSAEPPNWIDFCSTRLLRLHPQSALPCFALSEPTHPRRRLPLCTVGVFAFLEMGK